MSSSEQARASPSVGGIAAIANALISFIHLLILVAVTPTDASGGGTGTAMLPVLWYAPDGLKLLSAACVLVLVNTLRERMAARATPNVRWAVLSGFAGSTLATLSGLFGIFALAQAGRAGTPESSRRMVEEIADSATYLGLFALLAYGIWFLLTASAAMRRGGLPLRLAYLTFLLGAVNVLAFLLPPLAVLVLLIGSVWSAAMGFFLLREPTTP
jgi:hypothetical protein